jgi:hypothetical protein
MHSKSSKIGTLSNLLQNYSVNQKPIASLSTQQLQVSEIIVLVILTEVVKVLQRVSQLVQQLDPSFKMSNIEIVKFQKDTMLSSHSSSGTIQISLNLLSTEFVHSHWSEVDVGTSSSCTNTHNVEFDEEGGCCCRETKILEAIIKEKVLVHDPKADADLQNKMRFLLTNILFSQTLRTLFKQQRSEVLNVMERKVCPLLL